MIVISYIVIYIFGVFTVLIFLGRAGKNSGKIQEKIIVDAAEEMARNTIEKAEREAKAVIAAAEKQQEEAAEKQQAADAAKAAAQAEKWEVFGREERLDNLFSKVEKIRKIVYSREYKKLRDMAAEEVIKPYLLKEIKKSNQRLFLISTIMADIEKYKKEKITKKIIAANLK